MDYKIGDHIEVTQVSPFIEWGEDKVIGIEPVIGLTKTQVITYSHRFEQDHRGVLYQTNDAPGAWRRWTFTGRKVV